MQVPEKQHYPKKTWMMIKKTGDRLTLMPSAARLAGFYPEDFNRGEEQE